MQRRLLCASIPAPPDNIDFTLPAPTPDTPTTRDRIEAKTGVDGCNGCHDFINPAGFALESYDPVGAFRTEDNGVAVDDAATVRIGSEDREVAGGVELAHAVAESDAARACYVKRLVEFGLGREMSLRSCTLEALVEGLERNDSVVDLLVAIATTDLLTHRQAE